jgi:branched-chain amino acid transport system permease protein
MLELLGISAPMLAGQLLIGLINGAVYAMLSLGLAVIFGLLNIINVTHGAQYMMGAFGAWMLLNYFGVGYLPSLIIAPVLVGITGIILERVFIRWTYTLDHMYGFLLTFGLLMVIEGLYRQAYGTSGQIYNIPDIFRGGISLGIFILPYYRIWVVAVALVVCIGTWFVIERTRLGAYLRASIENTELVEAFGVNVPRMITLTYGYGVMLAALAGVMVAPIYQVGSLMGSRILPIVFAVVVIGGMRSIHGTIFTGFALGIIEGLTKVFYPEASTTVIFVVMVLVLLARPAGLFGTATPHVSHDPTAEIARPTRLLAIIVGGALLVLGLAGPFLFYPLFLMKALCYGLFACAFGLLIGYGGLMSFGHAAFFGGGAYVSAYTIKAWGLTPELGLLAGAATGALLGLVFGWLAIRRHGIYFTMITFALSQIVYFYALQAPWTQGEDGIQGVPQGYLFGLLDLSGTYNLYYFVLAVFLIAFFVIWRTVHSPFGQALKAIRGNENRAISLGYNVDRYKHLAFTLSATLAGLAGAMKSFVFQLASLSDVEWIVSGQVVLMTLIGGLGTMLGPLVGAFTLVAMENYFAEFGSWVTISQGAVFVLCVLAFRKGIVGEALNFLSRWPALATRHAASQNAPGNTGDRSGPERALKSAT